MTQSLLQRPDPTASGVPPCPRRTSIREIVQAEPVRCWSREMGWAMGECRMLALVFFRIPTGVRAGIEDVVVDPKRSMGLWGGRSPVQESSDVAVELGARTVDSRLSLPRRRESTLSAPCICSARQALWYRYTP